MPRARRVIPPFLRQIAGDHLGLGAAAQSERSRRLVPRTRTADKVVQSVADDDDGVSGAGAFFLLLDDPEVYGLPPDPIDPVRDIGSTWRAAGAAALALGAGLAAAVLGGRR